jgi:hypothetical protein
MNLILKGYKVRLHNTALIVLCPSSKIMIQPPFVCCIKPRSRVTSKIDTSRQPVSSSALDNYFLWVSEDFCGKFSNWAEM